MEYNTEYWNEMLEECLDYFDFERVHECMVALNWQWHDQGVPSVGDIRKRSRQLLKACIDTKICANATGGLKASIDREDGVLSLEFIVSDWDAYKEIDSE